MTNDEYIAQIRLHADEMIAAAEELDLDTPVPSCPGWTMKDLLVHTGSVHRHKTMTVRDGYVTSQPPYEEACEGDVLQWFAEGVDQMLAVFGTSDLSAPTWTWSAQDHLASWWVRRMAHETAIHAADATLSTGRTPRLDVSLAADGVSEVLVEFMAGAPAWGTVTPGDRRIDLVTPNRTWKIRTATFAGTDPESGTAYEGYDKIMSADDGAPEAVVTTDPESLDLWLWGRRELPLDAFSGDAALIDYLRAVAAEETQ